MPNNKRPINEMNSMWIHIHIVRYYQMLRYKYTEFLLSVTNTGRLSA